jgi:hypothetical protein
LSPAAEEVEGGDGGEGGDVELTEFVEDGVREVFLEEGELLRVGAARGLSLA